MLTKIEIVLKVGCAQVGVPELRDLPSSPPGTDSSIIRFTVDELAFNGVARHMNVEQPLGRSCTPVLERAGSLLSDASA